MVLHSNPLCLHLGQCGSDEGTTRLTLVGKAGPGRGPERRAGLVVAEWHQGAQHFVKITRNLYCVWVTLTYGEMAHMSQCIIHLIQTQHRNVITSLFDILQSCRCLNPMYPHVGTVFQNGLRYSQSAKIKRPWRLTNVKPHSLGRMSLCIKVGIVPFGSKGSSELWVSMLTHSDMWYVDLRINLLWGQFCSRPRIL